MIPTSPYLSNVQFYFTALTHLSIVICIQKPVLMQTNKNGSSPIWCTFVHLSNLICMQRPIIMESVPFGVHFGCLISLKISTYDPKRFAVFFLKWTFPGLFFTYFRSFQTIIWQNKTVELSRIQTRIIGVEGEHADHLPTTTALCFAVLDNTAMVLGRYCAYVKEEIKRFGHC